MIKPRVTTKVNGQGNVDKFLLMLQKLKGAYVTIGIHEDAGSYDNGVSVVEVALWNEFGTEHSPERSFFRSVLDEKVSLINSWREETLKQIGEGKDPMKAMSSFGFKLQVLIQNKIKSNVSPANAPSTTESKLRRGVVPRTLIDSTLMLRSVTFKVFL
jgi:hypothetical protein